MRLRLAMDAWCALWFWPASPDGGYLAEPPTLDEWITTLEGLLGAAGVKKGAEGQAMFHESVEQFEQISKLDEVERQFSGMRAVWDLVSEHSWLGAARLIAETQGFFHWELDIGQVFHRGGFDLQLGNPPWVRPDWWEINVLADFDPYLALENNIAEAELQRRRSAALGAASVKTRYLADVAAWFGQAEILGSERVYPDLAGMRTNLYLNFIAVSWRNATRRGVVGLIHPDTHFTDPKAGRFRELVYQRLRRHWVFVNEMPLFEDVMHHTVFGVHVYGPVGDIHFLQAAGLIDPDTLEGSLTGAGRDAEVPGVQLSGGGWDFRPHPSRIVEIDAETLAQWVRLFDPIGTSPSRARLLRPLTSEHRDILSIFAVGICGCKISVIGGGAYGTKKLRRSATRSNGGPIFRSSWMK